MEAFRTRPLDAGAYPFVAADALMLKVRAGGRVVNVHALIAVQVNTEGYREILGLDVTTAEDGAGVADVLAVADRQVWVVAVGTHPAPLGVRATDREFVAAQYDRIIDALSDMLAKVAYQLESARPDLLAFTSFPKEIWRQIWSNKPRNGSTRFGGAWRCADLGWQVSRLRDRPPPGQAV
ncbi:hypothetical protein LAUMK42_01573 [Mycobacterium persicum]|uniref:Mutator family transposase n=1 Tax=Mycobacterium persicum TaxID=1487726 RepID=A0AB38UPV4_9MYCO|nr:hypothetical protein B1T49_22090 [Mycobacterium persicum]VAZ82763.1 hypothetical protein LAUMK42_01573 [Mycobacterium persicum]